MADARKIAIWGGAGCLVLLLSFACCGGVAYYGFDQMFAGPRRMANGFFLDLREGRLDAAYDRMGRTYQDTHDRDAFEVAVGQLPALTQHTAVSWSGIHVANDRARLSGALETASGPLPIEVELTRASNGHWYLDVVTVQGAALP